MSRAMGSGDSPINFEDELEPIRKKKSGLSRVGGVLGRSVVRVYQSTTPDAVKDVWKLARWETTNVRCWRTLIFLLLLITGAFVSSYTFVFLKKEQESDFEDNVSTMVVYYQLDLFQSLYLTQNILVSFQYKLFANRIEYAVAEGIEAVVLATRNIAKTVSGAAKSTESSFPNVTVPLFEITGYTARHEAHLDMVAYTPVVTETQRAAWQSYSADNIGWVAQSRLFLEGKEADEASFTSSTSTAVRPFIWQMNEMGEKISAFPSPYLPIWQVSSFLHSKLKPCNTVLSLGSSLTRCFVFHTQQTTPPPAAPDRLINYNMLSVSYVENIFRAILIIREGALSTLEDFSEHLHAIQNTEPLPPVDTGVVDENVEQRSVFVQPVYSDVTNPQSIIVGLVHGLFAWSTFLENILPSDAQGVYVVLKNTCDQEATYKIAGGEATYIGFGDFHETQWDHLEHRFVLSDIVSESSMEEDGHCMYSLFIYPSDELFDVWYGLTPLLFSVTAAGAFLLIAITFIMYDRYVIRRNERMIDQAARTNKM